MKLTSMKLVLLLTLLGSFGCGDDTESKGADYGGVPLSNGNPADLLSKYGTNGTEDKSAKSPKGNAYCDLSGIKTDDLNEKLSADVPDGAWGGVISDSAARCGDDVETAVWRLMNCERISRDIAPIDCDLRMVYLGRSHSSDMSSRNYFDHSTPEGKSPFNRLDDKDVDWRGAGENIALNPSALGAHHSWMDSDGHRGNILGDFTYTGCGMVDNHYTNVFIKN